MTRATGAGDVPASGWLTRAATAMVHRAVSRGERRLTILIFHRVTPEPDPLFPDEMYAGRFEAVARTLASNFDVIPLHEAIARLGSSDLPSRAVSITFDDGYADNYTVACPILRRHGLHATFFVASGFLDGGVMWNDEAIEAIRTCTRPTVDAGWLGAGILAVTSHEQRRAAIEALLPRLKYLALSARADALARLREQTGSTARTDLMLSSAQLRALRDAGMEIGGHTLTHPILAVLSDQEARDQIGADRERLAGLLGAAPHLFAYPNGKPETDYTRAHVDMVRDCGYGAAVSTAAGSAGPESDRFQLPRFTPWDTSASRFALRLAHNAGRRDAVTA